MISTHYFGDRLPTDGNLYKVAISSCESPAQLTSNPKNHILNVFLNEVTFNEYMIIVDKAILVLLKGTVARDFWPLVFFMNSPHIDH